VRPDRPTSPVRCVRGGRELTAGTHGGDNGGVTAPLRRVAGAREVAFDALTGAEIGTWHELRAADPALDSPYFHPGFAAAVHASGRPVSVVVLRDTEGAVCGLMPGHRDGVRLRPVGWPGADFQGPIIASGTIFSPPDLLVDGLREFQFDHLIPRGAAFDPWIISTQSSPYLDTTDGLDGYLARASRSGKDNMGQARRRTAKAARTHGPVRFTADVVDDAALAELIALKRGQYAATGARDFFRDPDRIDLMERLMYTRDPAFAGILSTLHVGEQLMAAHFGIRADHVLHWWFPVYDPSFAQLAPGWILLRELVSAAPELGIDRIDLGRGDDEYKRRAKTGETIVSQGVVTKSTVRLMLSRRRNAVIEAAKASPVGPGLREAARRFRAFTGPGSTPSET
jgi:CelD/BcsL family acetyltransferase involved in cellulose biosynthesis